MTSYEVAEKAARTTFNSAFDFFKDNVEPVFRGFRVGLENSGEGLKTLTGISLHEDDLKFKTEVEQARLKTQIIAREMPSQNNTVYCNTIIANLGPVAMYWFALAVENAVVQAIDFLFLDIGSDGVGADYWRYAMKMMCPDSSDPLFKNQAKTMNPLMSSNPMCAADKEYFTDADISTRLFSGRNDTVLEMPPLVSVEYALPDGSKKTYRLPMPDSTLNVSDGDKAEDMMQEKYQAQQAFMAAVNYCIRTAGPRPTPPGGDAVFSAAGIAYLAKWSTCSARRSALIKQCAKMIAKHTRPDCRIKDFEPVCRASTLACEAALSLNSQIPFSCKYPMTKYQSEMAARMACFGREKTLWESSDKKENGEAPLKSAQCARDYQMWQAQQATELRGFAMAMAELADIWTCWPRDKVEPEIGYRNTRRYPPNTATVSSGMTGTLCSVGTVGTGTSTGTGLGICTMTGPSMGTGFSSVSGTIDIVALRSALEGLVGTPYDWGSTDCSHMVQLAYARAGMPYTYLDSRSFIAAAASGTSGFVVAADQSNPPDGAIGAYAGHMLIYDAGYGDGFNAWSTKSGGYGRTNYESFRGSIVWYVPAST